MRARRQPTPNDPAEPRRRPSRTACVLVLGLLVLPARPALSGFGYPSPFAPEQCAPALQHAERLISAAQEGRGRRLQAEALLCLGVQDDPAALDQAITALRRIVHEDADDFFARLYLAEALRHRYSLSAEVLDAYKEAAAALRQVDVGAARGELEAYIARTLDRTRMMQTHAADGLRSGAAAVRAGEADSFRTGEWLKLLARTGPAGLRRAVELLEAHVAAEPRATVIDTFYRAELLRGQMSKEELRSLYRRAAEVVCKTEGPAAEQVCSLARMRLQRLDGAESTAGAEGAVGSTVQIQERRYGGSVDEEPNVEERRTS